MWSNASSTRQGNTGAAGLAFRVGWLRRQLQLRCECRTFSRRALHRDITAHRRSEPFGDCQAKSGAADLPVDGRVRLFEFTKETAHILCG